MHPEGCSKIWRCAGSVHVVGLTQSFQKEPLCCSEISHDLQSHGFSTFNLKWYFQYIYLEMIQNIWNIDGCIYSQFFFGCERILLGSNNFMVSLVQTLLPRCTSWCNLDPKFDKSHLKMATWQQNCFWDCHKRETTKCQQNKVVKVNVVMCLTKSLGVY